MRFTILVVPVVLFAPSVALVAQRVHDSAGIRIVENPSIATLPVRFRLAPTPDIVIGGLRDKPEEELDTKSGYFDAVRLSGNRILVTDHDKLKLFDAKGTLLQTFGRSGAGPGEFRTAQMLCRFRGDSVLAWDVSNRRISVWSGDGKLAREYTPAGFAGGANACNSDGSILIAGTHAESPREDRPLTTYVLLSGTGAPIATSPALPATLYSGSVWRDVQFGAHNGRFVLGDEVELGALVLDRLGKVVEIFRTADRPDPVTESSMAARSMSCSPNPATHVCTPAPTKARTWSAYFKMKVDDNGRSWFKLNMGSNDSVWVAFDSTGNAVGKLVMPAAGAKANRQVIRFGKNDALIMDFDSDGARRVSSYRIIAN